MIEKLIEYIARIGRDDIFYATNGEIFKRK